MGATCLTMSTACVRIGEWTEVSDDGRADLALTSNFLYEG